MISAISSFSALSSNMKIMASASNAAPVPEVSRVTRKSQVDDTEFHFLNQSDKSNQLPQDKLVLLGENAVKSGKAYGIDINELRNQSLKNQLSENSTKPEIIGDTENNEEGIISEKAVENNAVPLEESEESEKNASDKELSQEDQEQVKKLKQRDAEVKAHEQAHLAVAGSLAQGGASYEFEQGPDGKNYAVGGEVSIDTSPGATPEETIVKMQQVKAAALAPAEPSGQDRSVAASATQQIVKAQQEIHEEPSVEEEEKQGTEIKRSAANSEKNDTDPKTVEEYQEIMVEEALDGKTNEKTVESGLIDISSEIKPDTNSANNRNYVPQAKLSIQQHAARVAYGISA